MHVTPVSLAGHCEAGVLNRENARYVLAVLDTAIRGCRDERFAAMVTAPVHKGVINDAAGQKAMDVLVNKIIPLTPKGSSNWFIDEVNAAISQGKVCVGFQWIAAMGGLLDPANSELGKTKEAKEQLPIFIARTSHYVLSKNPTVTAKPL